VYFIYLKGVFMKKLLLLIATTIFIPAVVYASDAGDYYTAGLHYYQQGQNDKAIQYCQNAIQADPNFWQAYQVLGYSYYAEKNNTQALQALDKSLQLNPNNPQLQQFDTQLHASTPDAPAPSASPDTTTSNVVTPPSPGATLVATTPSDKRDHNLPKAGAFNLEGTVAYVYPGTQDLQDFYGNVYIDGVQEAVELNLGAAYSFTPNLQADLLLEFGGKVPVDVADGDDDDQWNEYYIGGAAGLNILLPVSDGINFVMHGEGGYYALVGTQINVSGFDSGTVNLDASAPGFAVAAGLEFLMNKQKNWAMEVELGYRYLKFSPLTASGDFDGSTFGPETWINQDGSGTNASIDFSGPRLSLGARL
jgi:tetratricopeptide (TPR) repeat protein